MTESQLARGLRALEHLAREPARSTDVADALGVHRSTAMRLLRELESLGWVNRPDGGSRYALSVERFAWVLPALDAADSVTHVRPILEEMSAFTGEATLLAMPVGSEMSYVAYTPARSAIGVQERIGTHRPLHASAVGQAWLSGLPDEERHALIASLALAGGTSRAVQTREQLEERAVEARTRGWALDREETIEGAVCVAVPVWVREQLIGAAAVSAPATRVDEATLSDFGRRLRDLCVASHLAGPAGVAH